MKRIAASLRHHSHQTRTRALLVRCVAFLTFAVTASGCHTLMGRDVSPTTESPSPSSASGRNENLPAPEWAKLCLATGDVMEQSEKHLEAIEQYEKARQLDTRVGTQATPRLAVIHDRIGNFDKALDEYRRGIQENPKNPELYNNLGYGYYCRGQWEAAEKNLRKAVSLDPKMSNAWTNLGLCLAVQSRYDESLAAFEKTVSKAQARCNVAYIQAAQSKLLEARRNYEAALQLEPGLQMARIALQKLNQPSVQGPLPNAERRREMSPSEQDVIQLPSRD